MHFDVFQVEQRPDCLYVAAHFWDTAADQAAGRPVRVTNDFKIRSSLDHQRIRRGPAGGLLHISGAEVPLTECRRFLQAEGIEYSRDDAGRIVTTRQGHWRRRRGTAIAPFHFRGRDHDPQWVRERFQISEEMLIARTLTRYGQIASTRGWSGDRRGTSLDLVVEASGDDGHWSSDATDWDEASTLTVGLTFGNAYHAWYRFTGTEDIGGATINAAEIQLWSGGLSEGSAETQIYACDDAAPTPPADETEGDALSLTAASVAWDSPSLAGSYTSSPDISAVIQELADSYTPTAVMIVHKNDGGIADDYIIAESYDSDSSHAPKLLVDLTGDPPVFDTALHAGLGLRRPIYQR